MAGRRRGYVGPFKLYIVTFAVMMLLATLFQKPDARTVLRESNGSVMKCEYLLDASLIVPLQPLVRASPGAGATVAMVVSIGAVAACVLLAIRRVYGDRGWSAWLRAAALFAAYHLAQAVSSGLALISGIAWLMYG